MTQYVYQATTVEQDRLEALQEIECPDCGETYLECVEHICDPDVVRIRMRRYRRSESFRGWRSDQYPSFGDRLEVGATLLDDNFGG